MGPIGNEAHNVSNSRRNQMEGEEIEDLNQKSDYGNRLYENPSDQVPPESMEFSGIEELDDEVSVVEKYSVAENETNSRSESKSIRNEPDEAKTEEEEYESDENLPVDEDYEENEGELDDDRDDDGDDDREDEELLVPESSQRYLPSTSERKKIRQGNLNRYLGIQDKTSQLGLSALMPPPAPAVKKSVAAEKKAKKTPKVPKTVFPSKVIKFEFNRFSRYKVKKDAECVLEDASQDFIEMAMNRLTVVAMARGATKIHLCDIRQVMGESGFLKRVEEDPRNQWLFLTLRQLVREDLFDELIPRTRGPGRVHPPKDCWEERGGIDKNAASISPDKKGKSSSGSSDLPTANKRKSSVSRFKDGMSAGPTSSRTSLASGTKKASKIKRFKALDLEDSEGSGGEGEVVKVKSKANGGKRYRLDK